VVSVLAEARAAVEKADIVRGLSRQLGRFKNVHVAIYEDTYLDARDVLDRMGISFQAYMENITQLIGMEDSRVIQALIDLRKKNVQEGKSEIDIRDANSIFDAIEATAPVDAWKEE